MKAVSRFEHNLLRILQGVLTRSPLDQIKKTLLPPVSRPPCLSRDAVELVKDTLAKGCARRLAIAGGWRRERFLRDGRARLGRLWERTPSPRLALSFTRVSLDFLMWIAGSDLSKFRLPWRPVGKPSVGDMLFLTWAHQTLETAEFAVALRKIPLMAHNVLCRLQFATWFAGREGLESVDFEPWLTEPGSCVLETLQSDLAEAWLKADRAKARIADWQMMKRLGQAQQEVLDPFLTALEKAGRRDLARFLLQALSERFRANVQPGDWVGGLPAQGPRLAERELTNRAALALVNQMERLQVWQRQARREGPMDEDYAASQLWLADWERYDGEDLYRRSREIIHQLDPLRPT